MKYQPAPWIRRCIGLLVLASLGVSAPAGAQDHSPSLAILGLSSKDGDDEPAAELTGALRQQAASSSALRLSDSTALLSQLVILYDCEISEPGCRDRIARELEVEELIYGVIRRTERGHAVELHRYCAADGSLKHASRDLTIEGASSAELASDARDLLRELYPSERPEPVAAAPAPKPMRKRLPVLAPKPLDPEPQDEPSSNDWLGYSLLGVAAVSTGLMVFSWNEIDAARNDPDFRAYREAVGRAGNGDDVDDVCTEADAGEAYGLGERLKSVRTACGRGVTFEVLQWVFLGSALVSSGFGIYFLLDDEGEPGATRASLMPMLGKGDAGLSLRVQL